MQNRDIDVFKNFFPAGFQRDFDAHIYYSLENRAQAEVLRKKAIRDFQNKSIWIGALTDELVGPHPMPMFEINFSQKFYTEMLLWFMDERGNLPVLIHPVSGDDFTDHFEKALWLGETQPLDASKLDPTTL